jgi:hypothetical protein
MGVLLSSSKHLLKCVQLQSRAVTCALCCCCCTAVITAANQHNRFQLRAVLDTCCYLRDFTSFAHNSLASDAVNAVAAVAVAAVAVVVIVSTVVIQTGMRHIAIDTRYCQLS